MRSLVRDGKADYLSQIYEILRIFVGKFRE